jgi:hypothetical protein
MFAVRNCNMSDVAISPLSDLGNVTLNTLDVLAMEKIFAVSNYACFAGCGPSGWSKSDNSIKSGEFFQNKFQSIKATL